MVIKCLECNHKCGAPFNLAFHYSICHEDKIGNCACGDKTLSGICIKELAQRTCLVNHERSSFANSPIKTNRSFKDEFGYSPSIDSSSNASSSPNPSSSSNRSPDSSPNPSSSSKVITRCCNRCNYVKPLTNFHKIVLLLKLVVYIALLL